MKTWAAVLIAILLTGCAVKPQPVQQFSSVWSDSVKERIELCQHATHSALLRAGGDASMLADPKVAAAVLELYQRCLKATGATI
ncbi:hypothetical protein D3C77_34440 [compost metagenome]